MSEAHDTLVKEPEKFPVLPLNFLTVKDFTTFEAQYAITDGDLVFHFYVTDEVNKLADPRLYWLTVFAECLEQTAVDYFKAGAARLKAAYTEEKASWWLRALGFGLVLDPHKSVYGFLEALDRSCDAAMKNRT